MAGSLGRQDSPAGAGAKAAAAPPIARLARRAKAATPRAGRTIVGWSSILVRAGLGLAFAGLAAFAVPAAAAELPRAADVALPEEREALAALTAAVPAEF